jgi:hypothetical protein
MTSGPWLSRTWIGLLPVLVAGVGGVTGCNTMPPPRVSYSGQPFGRAPKPVEMMEVFRAGPPPPRFQDLGTVSVTCPSQVRNDSFLATSTTVGGCSYEWAVWKACQRAAAAGADGIHSIESTTNSGGAVVSLRASVFVRLPKLVVPAAPEETADRPSIEDRLRRLEKLKSEQLITPEEYEKKRAEILGEI